MNQIRGRTALRIALTAVIFCVGVIFWMGAVAKPLLANDDESYLPGEVVVKLLQTSDLATVAATFQLDPTPLDQFGARPIYRLRILDGADPLAKADTLAKDARIQYAEPNFIEETPEGRQRMRWSSGGSGGEFGEQWAGSKIGLADAHKVTRGAGITVAVLDTGIDLDHTAFTGRLVPGYDYVDMDTEPREEGNYDANLGFGHGTHVAGLVALTAPEAKIMPIRVLDADGRGNIWVLAEALAYAVDPDGNPATNDGAQVINLSLSTRRHTDLLENIIREVTCNSDDDDDDDDDKDEDIDDDDDDDCPILNGRGAVIVAAAGNRTSDLLEYPAAEGVNGLLAVAATTESDVLADFSNYGGWIHVAAPGEKIMGPVPGNEYGVWNGTSMAAPLVAGQAALLRAVHADWDAAAVTSQIVSKATDIGGPVPRRVHASAALAGAASEVVYAFHLALIKN